MNFRKVLALVFALFIVGTATWAHAQTATPTATATSTPVAPPSAGGGISGCVTANSTGSGATALFAVNGGRRGLKCQDESSGTAAYISFGTLPTGCIANTNALILPVTSAGVDNSLTWNGNQGIAGMGGSAPPTGDVTVCTASGSATVCCVQW